MQSELMVFLKMGNTGVLYTDKNEIGETERQRERESERQTIHSRGILEIRKEQSF